MAPSEAPPPRPHSLSVGTITGVDYDFQLAVAFVNDHTHSDLKLNDQQNLELYALFKQATLGDAKKKDQPLVSLAAEDVRPLCEHMFGTCHIPVHGTHLCMAHTCVWHIVS